MDEVAPEEPALLTPLPDNGVGSTPESVLGKEIIKEMEVSDLCIALEAHNNNNNNNIRLLLLRI